MKSQIKTKGMEASICRITIQALNKFSIYQFLLFYWKREITNNHYNIIRLASLLDLSI